MSNYKNYEKALNNAEWSRLYNPDILQSVVIAVETGNVSVWSKELCNLIECNGGGGGGIRNWLRLGNKLPVACQERQKSYGAGLYGVVNCVSAHCGGKIVIKS